MTKLSDKQREVLQLMASGEYTLQHTYGMGNFMREYFSFEPVPPGHTWREDMRTIQGLEKRGLIHWGELSKDWRSRDYHLTAAGHAALEETK